MQGIEGVRRALLEKMAPTKGYVNTAAVAKALVIVSAVLLFYGQDLGTILVDAFQNEAANYVFLIPPIFAYFIYRKRKMLRAVIASAGGGAENLRFLVPLSGVLLCITAMMFYWYGANTFSPLEYRVLTLPLFTAGVVLVLFNLQTLRQLAFPIFFLAFLVPLPSQFLDNIGSALSVTGSELSANIISVLGVHTQILSEYGNPIIMITRPDRTVLGFTLDVACSGVYPLLGFLIFAFFMAYITRGALWKKATIFIVGLPLIFSLNIVRITSILLIGFSYGQELALQAFHLVGGLVLVVLGVILLFAIMEKLFKTRVFRGAMLTQTCTRCTSPENADEGHCVYCGKFLSLRKPQIAVHRRDVVKILSVAILVMLMMLTQIQIPALASPSKPLPVFVQTQDGEQGNTQIFPEISGYKLAFLYRDTDFENTAKQDASLTYTYQSNDVHGTMAIAVELAEARSSLHDWEVCLITWRQTHGSQPRVTQLDLRDVRMLDNPPMVGRYFAFQYPNSTQTEVVLYWYDQSTFVIGNETKHEHAKISLISFLGTPNDVAEAESTLLVFGMQVARYWQPIKTWTAVSLTLSQNGLVLALVPVGLLVNTVAIGLVIESRRQKGKARAYHKLSEEDRLFIDSVRQAMKNSRATLEKVVAAYKSTANREIEDKVLRLKLIQAEEAGLVSKKLISQSDEPFYTWTVNLKA
jgi:exosortase